MYNYTTLTYTHTYTHVTLQCSPSTVFTELQCSIHMYLRVQVKCGKCGLTVGRGCEGSKGRHNVQACITQQPPNWSVQHGYELSITPQVFLWPSVAHRYLATGGHRDPSPLDQLQCVLLRIVPGEGEKGNKHKRRCDWSILTPNDAWRGTRARTCLVRSSFPRSRTARPPSAACEPASR